MMSSQKFQHFSRNVKNGGGEISGHLWKITGARALSRAGWRPLQVEVELVLETVSELGTFLSTSFSERILIPQH